MTNYSRTKRRSTKLFLGLLLAVLILQQCKKEEYRFDFLPAGAIRDSIHVTGGLMIDSVKIRSEAGLDSVMGYLFTIRSASDTSIFLTKVDTSLVKKVSSFPDPHNYVFIDTINNYISQHPVGYMYRTWDKRKQRSQKVRNLSWDLGLNYYVTGATNNFNGLSVSLNAQGNKGTAPGSAFSSSLGRTFIYYTTTASDTAAIKNCANIDFVFWHDGTNFQLRSVYDVSNLGTQFFVAANIWPTRNHTIFKKITGDPGFPNINLAITAEDLGTVDFTGVTDEVVNIAAKDLIAFQTSSGKKGILCITALAPNATLNKSKINMTVKVQK